MQPIRKSVDYKKYFSNELNGLLDDMMSSMHSENPVSEISTEFFLMFALESTDCMLYKAVNSFLNTFAIGKIHDKFYLSVQDESLSAIRPGRTIDYSQEFTKYLSRSYDEAGKVGSKLVTSDHVLLSILSDTKNTEIKKTFFESGLTYEILLEKVKKLHEITEKVNTIVEEEIQPVLPENALGDIRGPVPESVKILIPGDNVQDVLQNAMPTLLREIGKEERKSVKAQIQFCKNLNKIAENGGIDPIIGREKEISNIEKVFARRKCNNVMLVGKSGVGKTALIEGLAKMVQEKTAPVSLVNYKFFSLNVNELISGTNLRGMFEERVNRVFNELKNIKNAVIFIDDAHVLINERKNDDYNFIELIDSNIQGNDIKLILSTNEKGYKTILQTAPNVMRKFQKVTLEGTNEEETLQILENIKGYYEDFHKVTYSKDVLSACIKLSKRYIPEISLPSSAIDIMDEVGACHKLKIKNSTNVNEKLKEVSELRTLKEVLISGDKIERAKKLEEEIIQLNSEIVTAIAKSENPTDEERVITMDDLYETVSSHTNIPVEKINISEKKSVANIDTILKENIIGQDEAITAITNAIKRSKIGLFPSNRPTYSALLLGNSGVGKTLTAKMLAKEIFGDEKYLVRFDMSEYSDKTSVNKLIGSNAGYVGYENGGLLTEAIKQKKHAVLLIDEIEKADDEVYNLFLQVLDDGFLTDNMGNKVDFKNAIILLTSNVGAKKASNHSSMAFVTNNSINKKDIIKKELKNKFPPEFINRLDDIIYYNDLTDESLISIIKLEMEKLSKRVSEIGYKLEYENEIVDYIFKNISGEKEYGARPIVRIIQSKIENALADYILENDDCSVLKVSIDETKENVIINK